MNDDSLFTLVRTQFEPVRLPHGLDHVLTRGRGLRRRRRVAAVLACALALALLALALPVHRAAPVQLAAWSVDARPDGTVVLTIRQLARPEELTAALGKAGVPALVEFKQIEPGDPGPVGCVARQPALPQLDDVMVAGDDRTFTIRRAAMPAGTSLHFVVFQEGGQRMVESSLVRGRPLPCRLLSAPRW
jgi:hypothetical protein